MKPGRLGRNKKTEAKVCNAGGVGIKEESRCLKAPPGPLTAVLDDD